MFSQARRPSEPFLAPAGHRFQAGSGATEFRHLPQQLHFHAEPLKHVRAWKTAVPFPFEAQIGPRGDGAESFAAQQPVRRLLQPDEVAAALAWLAGEGSSAMTGAVIPVDGGLAL